MGEQTSQFRFLPPGISQDAARAEAAVHSDPRAACFYARRTLELIVDWLYDNDEAFEEPWETHLSALLAAPCFLQHVPAAIVAKAKVIKGLGNHAVHGKGQIRTTDALTAVSELFHVAYWFARTYSADWTPAHEKLNFDPAKLPPAPAPGTAGKGVAPEALQKLQEELKAKDEALRQSREAIERNDAEIARLQSEIAATKARAAGSADTHDYTEAQTRDRFIDLLLRESGWGMNGWKVGEETEYPVKGMAKGGGKTGDGFVDYVLWGDDGKPLGLVEAKRTRKDARVGQTQAGLYADCLEKEFGRRPIIYFTNGYETWVWDDHFYPPREVSGFHTKDELELMIARRAGPRARVDPNKETVSRAIVERPYQMEAIREVGKRLSGGHRKALLVMATGSGKTRVAIARATGSSFQRVE